MRKGDHSTKKAHRIRAAKTAKPPSKQSRGDTERQAGEQSNAAPAAPAGNMGAQGGLNPEAPVTVTPFRQPQNTAEQGASPIVAPHTVDDESRSDTRKNPVDSALQPTPASARGAVTRSSRKIPPLLNELLWVLLIAGVFICVRLPFERTYFVDYTKLTIYNFLQHQLSAAFGQRTLPVVIVDITNEPGTIGNELTSRQNLTEIIDVLSNMKKEHRPRAIGVDIDCSPRDLSTNGSTRGLTEEEVDFYDFCLNLSNRQGDPIPVLLGVDRTATGRYADWLLSPKYADLAAGLRISLDERHEMWRWIQTPDSARPLVGIGAALARSYRGQARQKGLAWWHWFAVTEKDDDLAHGLKVRGFKVDYSPIDKLQAEAIPEADVLNAKDMATRDFSQQVVLIGNSSNETIDKMVVPNKTKAYPGVLVHACVVYTMLQSPLYEMTAIGRTVADFGLAVAIFIFAELLMHLKRDEKYVPLNHIIATFVIILITFLLGVLFVNATRLIWDDFLLVDLALVLHLLFSLRRQKTAHRRQGHHHVDPNETEPLMPAPCANLEAK